MQMYVDAHQVWINLFKELIYDFLMKNEWNS